MKQGVFGGGNLRINRFFTPDTRASEATEIDVLTRDFAGLGAWSAMRRLQSVAGRLSRPEDTNFRARPAGNLPYAWTGV